MTTATTIDAYTAIAKRAAIRDLVASTERLVAPHRPWIDNLRDIASAYVAEECGMDDLTLTCIMAELSRAAMDADRSDYPNFLLTPIWRGV